MRLFDDEKYAYFFNPFCCRNKQIYYDCILQLIDKSKSLPLLYEKDARDTLTLYFRNCRYAVQDEDLNTSAEETISSNKSEAENASAVLRYFRHCGWLTQKEIGRNGDNIATVHPYCLKLIDAIERIFNRNNGAALTNHIFAIYDILRSIFIADHGRTQRPYSNILVPTADSVTDLNSELLTLKDSIRFIMRQILQLSETNALGQFLLKSTVMEKFFRDYFFIKKDGMIPGYISEITKMLRKIRKHDIYGKMINEYQQLYEVDQSQAKTVVDETLSRIESFINHDYPLEMDYIDKKINSYYNLYATRILMVISNKVNMQTYLNDLLLQLKALAPEERNQLLQPLSESFNLQSYGFIGPKSLTRRRKARQNLKSGALVESALTNEELLEQARKFIEEYPDAYSVKNTRKYFEALLAEKDTLVLESHLIHNRHDAMMMGACILYSGAADFGFAIEFLPGMVETPVATISALKIERMKNE